MGVRNTVDFKDTHTDVITTDNGTVFSTKNVNKISVQCVVDVDVPANDTFLAGEAAIETLTFDTQANTGDGDYIVVYDVNGQAWAVAADKTGSSAEPTGAIWVAIGAAFKAQADISGDTTAAQVAASFETAFDGISGFTAVITSDDTAADGTMTMTGVTRGPVTASVPKNSTDAGAGSISAATTNAGVASTIDTSTEYITITAHDFTTGLKVQASSTGTLPSGLSTSTDYFVIDVDANTIQLASSLSNALAGTAINLTDQGTDGATHTIEVSALAGATVSLQKTNVEANERTSSDWDDVATPTSITADGNVWLSDVDVEYKYARVQYTLTAGQLSAENYIVGRE